MPVAATIIGLGFIGASESPGNTIVSHASAYIEHPEVSLTAGADPDPAKREAFVSTWGVERVFADYREMLSECRPGMTSICAPTPLHHNMVKDAITAGVRLIFLEKPVTENLEQADNLIELARKSGATIAVNYGRVWEQNTWDMIAELKQGIIGEIKAVRGTFTGGVVHNGTHMFQLVNEVLGQPLVVEASLDTVGVLAGVVDYPGGRRAVFNGFEMQGYSLHELDFITSSGRCLYLSGGEMIKFFEARDSEIYPGFKILKETRVVQNTGLSGSMSTAISDLLESARAGRSPRCGLVQGRQALALGLAMEESCRSGGKRILLESTHSKGSRSHG